MKPYKMEVGSAKVILDFYGNTESRKKNAFLKDLCADLRKKFNVSAKEVEDFQEPERCVIGIALVGSEQMQVQDYLNKILNWIDDNSQARVITEFTDIVPFSEN